jgi:hypothetical protein
MGRGIISNDGPVWEHARGAIRPAFTRAEIANPEAFGVHVERFLNLLPMDGSVVDLQPLFDRLVSVSCVVAVMLLLLSGVLTCRCRFWTQALNSSLVRALGRFSLPAPLTVRNFLMRSMRRRRELGFGYC